MRRRWWLLVVCLVAGAAGGYFAGSRGGAGYTATAVLVVQAGTSTAVTSSANGAEELAVTYAALIPEDQALVARVAREVGSSTLTTSRGISVEAVAGTALIDVRFTASSPTAAVDGASDVARALTAVPPGQAIAPGSMSVVSMAKTASRAGALRMYGLPLGVLLGAVVGACGVVVAERTDRRVDDVETLGAVSGCAATQMPGGISVTELAASLDRGGIGSVTVVPLRTQQRGAALQLARALGTARRAGGGDSAHALLVALAGPFLSPPGGELGSGSGSVVLVVGLGERASAVNQVVERLRLLGRVPSWAVLVSAGGKKLTGDREG